MTAADSVISSLLRHRLLVILGKGGVGKTTVTAALASDAALRGVRVLAMESDLNGPLCRLLGARAGFEPSPAGPNLAAMLLEGRHSLEQYLRLVVPGGAMLGAVFHTRLYQYFVQAAPGLRELMMLGKIYFEVELSPAARNPPRMVVFDAPASGQALAMLRMPEAAREAFGESAVGREARNVSRVLHDQRTCAIVQVTIPEPLALAETLETHAAIAAMGLRVAAIVLNRNSRDSFDAAAVSRLAASPQVRSHLHHLNHITSLAREELTRARSSARALDTLRAETGAPILALPNLRGSSGSALVQQLSASLSAPTA